MQETPVSVGAFTAGQLEESGIYNIVDLETSVPNLQFSQGTLFGKNNTGGATYLPSEDFRVTVYANNLQDNFYYVSGVADTDALGASMLVQGPGRQLGLELNWEF